ncbi:uncharacterized protein J7T54_000755 [Emericellopsis cladophorae]|uniref:Uncharacterized protein n=1 Tax=Emericellopsis cladophorae TaxID=2686198 RepID=A0A9P9XVR8_9HYPO|nr:uncharacterized protein J7T54_000755 [Emericellopsis cladophorae]KAI6778721.1 hypothetical protein J7T54_000755 [Emericellopsis cladophorae]
MFNRFRRASSSSTESVPTPARRHSLACEPDHSCEGLSASDIRQLWRCMLELQERYGCYHSARIDVAMEAGDEGVDYMPNRFIIDTLNNSVLDSLPEEGWELLDKCLHPESSLKK